MPPLQCGGRPFIPALPGNIRLLRPGSLQEQSPAHEAVITKHRIGNHAVRHLCGTRRRQLLPQPALLMPLGLGLAWTARAGCASCTLLGLRQRSSWRSSSSGWPERRAKGRAVLQPATGAPDDACVGLCIPAAASSRGEAGGGARVPRARVPPPPPLPVPDS